MNIFKDKHVLVTGGTGLIGRQVVSQLFDAEGFVYSVSLDEVPIEDGITSIRGDLTDFEFCKEITLGMDYVFHLAGVKGSIDVTKSKPASFFVPLLMMNTNMLEACRLNKVQKVVYTSSIGAYSNAEVFIEGEDIDEGAPMDMFPGWAKRMAELQIKAYNIQYGLDNFAIVRPCNVYGPGDNFDPDNAMVIPSLMSRIYHKEDPVVIWGDGSAIRDFAYSEDIANGIILALERGTRGHYVNLGSGIGYSIKDLVLTLRSFIEFNYVFDVSKSSGFPRRIMDISLAKEMLGYEHNTSLLEGLQKTWDWYINHPTEYITRKNYFTEADNVRKCECAGCGR